jgi:uncharacterized membrane protein YeaQ/YmgE (transglycosylase-associated protein family)
MDFFGVSVSCAVDIGQDAFQALRAPMGTVRAKHSEEAILGGLIYWIVVGLIAGWLAGNVMKGGGYGVVMDIVLGIVGGVVGGFVFSLLGLHADSLIGQIIVAFVGALILVWIARKVKKA